MLIVDKCFHQTVKIMANKEVIYYKT